LCEKLTKKQLHCTTEKPKIFRKAGEQQWC